MCSKAVALQRLAEHDARAFIADAAYQYKAASVYRKNGQCIGFTFEDRPRAQQGFLPPVETQGKWVLIPIASTAIGKRASLILSEVSYYLHIAHWALEHMLGVYGYVIRGGRHIYARGMILSDDACFLRVPILPFDSRQARHKARDFINDIPEWIQAHRLSDSDLTRLYPETGIPVNVLERLS